MLFRLVNKIIQKVIVCLIIFSTDLVLSWFFYQKQYIDGISGVYSCIGADFTNVFRCLSRIKVNAPAADCEQYVNNFAI